MILVVNAGSSSAKVSLFDADLRELARGAVTEIVYALGAEKRLVARDSTSLYPEAALALPDVGYMRQLSPEGVLSVNPSAILMLGNLLSDLAVAFVDPRVRFE